MNTSHFASNTNVKAIPTIKQKIIEQKKSTKRIRLFLNLFLLFVIAYTAVIAAGSIFMDDEKLAQLEHLRTTETYVTIGQMPEYVPEAFLSIEDHRFYYHTGIDPISMARSLVVDLKTRSFAQGGSTITMQLTKNQFLTQEKSIGRKIKEVIIAINLERMYTKDELLEMYLNTIYFGHGQYGIEQAAQFYFGKSFLGNGTTGNKISLREAATLASLPKGPELYSPLSNPENAITRQAIVLNRMTELGIITSLEKEEALWKSVEDMTVRP